MKSFSKPFLQGLTLSNELVRMVRGMGEYKGRQELFRKQAPEILENLRQVALIQSAESSNRLEQVIAEPTRFREIMAERITPKDRSEAEIAGYRDVLNTLHSSANHIPFTEKVIRQFHRDMMKYTGLPGGTWKSTQNEITETRPDGTKRIRFTPLEPFQVADYMVRLHEFYNEEISKQAIDPLILIPLYILDFLCIHPFLDGNGRISRLATLLLLYQHGYEVGRYISLERIIENTKDSYYDTLESASAGWHQGKHDPIPWVTYFLSTTLAAYDEFERRANITISGRGSKTTMILSAIDNFAGDFSISDIERACPLVGRDMIRHVLNKLRGDGKVVNLSKGRYARWRKI